jgi:hemolysin activation/secretion protein
MLRSTLIAMALVSTSQFAFAQQPPPVAGNQLQQIPPPPMPERAAPDLAIEPPAPSAEPIPAGQSIQVRVVRVTGNTIFTEAELVAVANVTPGSSLTLAELQAAAARISGFYNKRGYFLAQAYLPAQDIQGGAVTIAVVEGRYGKVEIRNQSRLSSERAERVLDGLETDGLVTSQPLERRLLLLSDIPGVRVKSTLAPGGAVGTSDLIVDIAPGPAVSGSVEADNAGNRYTGTYRLGGTLYVNNPSGAGDQLSLRLLGSDGGLAYGRAAYQLPIGNATVGVAYTHLRYELGREFKALDGEGTADIASIFASYPLVRSRDANLYALVGFDAKWLKDRINLVSSESDRRVRVGSLGLSGDSRDHFGGGGSNLYAVSVSTGTLDIRNPIERAADALTARSDGHFSKLQLSMARIQSLSGPLSLYAAMRGQIAFDNLDSSEKMELGGAYGVRAYPEGEAYGDTGYIATLEARLMLDQWLGTFPGRIQLIGFVDAGEVKYAQDPWFVGSNRAHRSGIGGGLTWFAPGNLILKGSYAAKLGSAAATSAPDKGGRAWFQIVKLF